MKELLSCFSIILLLTLLCTPFVLKSCDREYEYQNAKYAQWAVDNQSEKPFKNFNE